MKIGIGSVLAGNPERHARRPRRRGEVGRGRRLRFLLASQHLRSRRDLGAVDRRPRDEPHRSRDRRHADTAAPSVFDRATGADRAGGLQGALRARHRALAQDRDREHARPLVRAAGQADARVPRGVDAARAGQAGGVLGRSLQRERRPPDRGRNTDARRRRGAGAQDVGRRGTTRRRHRDLDDRREDARRPHRAHHQRGGEGRRGARRRA